MSDFDQVPLMHPYYLKSGIFEAHSENEHTQLTLDERAFDLLRFAIFFICLGDARSACVDEGHKL